MGEPFVSKPLGQTKELEKPQKPEKKETFWTTTERESLKEKYGCEILVENGSPAEVQTREAPTDASIITYTVDGKEHQDLVRGTRVKLFDMYYDCLLYTSPSPRDRSISRMPSSA